MENTDYKNSLKPYLLMIEDFLNGNLSAGEVMHLYQKYYLNDPTSLQWDEKKYQILNEFFYDCEDFVEDPSLRRPEDYDEAELRRRAERARGEILALMEGDGGNGSAR